MTQITIPSAKDVRTQFRDAIEYGELSNDPLVAGIVKVIDRLTSRAIDANLAKARKDSKTPFRPVIAHSDIMAELAGVGPVEEAQFEAALAMYTADLQAKHYRVHGFADRFELSFRPRGQM